MVAQVSVYYDRASTKVTPIASRSSLMQFKSLFRDLTMPQLYGKNLFRRAVCFSSEVGGKNNPDVRFIESGPIKAAVNGHGICCGISAHWVVDFLNGDEKARDMDGFPHYFDSLRQRGTLHKYNRMHGVEHEFMMQQMDSMISKKRLSYAKQTFTDNDIRGGLSHHRKWAAYVRVWGHAIAVGKWQEGMMHKPARFIMEPNAGLFGYISKSDFRQDLLELIDARRAKKNISANTPANGWVYTR